MFIHLTAKRWTILLLISALIAALVPVTPALAANNFTFNNFSTSINSPTQVNSNMIDVAGTFNGVTANTITYKVEQVVNNVVAATFNGTGVAPIIEGLNSYTFPNVSLFSGINRITISGNASGSVVSAEAYVNFPNVPTIYDIRLVDNRVLQANKPTVVDTETITLMFKALNATNVTVQGRSAISGGGETYLISNLEVEDGMNTLVFTASNTTMTYSITRDVVYYSAAPTAYNVRVKGSTPANPTDVYLDNNPTVGPNGTDLVGPISGLIIVETEAGVGLEPVLNVALNRSNGASVAGSPSTVNPTNVTHVEDVTVTGATYTYSIFSFTTDNSMSISISDEYQLYLTGTYGTQTINYPMAFSYRSEFSPYITEVKQLYNVSLLGAEYSYSSSSVFADNMTFFQAPIWLSVSTENFVTSDSNYQATITTSQGGVSIGTPTFTYNKTDHPYNLTSNGDLVFQLTNLPAGEQMLSITVTNIVTGEQDTKNIPLTFIPTPFLQLGNVYDNQIFTNANTALFGATIAPLDRLRVKMINFNMAGAADRNSVTVTVNGTSRNALTHNTLFAFEQSGAVYTGGFSFLDPTIDLVTGPNTIVISAIAGNIPVSTQFTIYLFPDELPEVLSITPYPVGATTDPNNRFELTGERAYTTTERNMDVYFTVNSGHTQQVVVTIDGEQYAQANLGSSEGSKLIHVSTAGGITQYRLPSISLPNAGIKSITITGREGTATSSKTLQITRVRVPFRILSPLLPEEQVINQNFLSVSIQAEGADSIAIGKEEMLKGTDDIFRLDVKNLKNGNNTIKFTVSTDSAKTNGQFSVTYATQNVVGAQYKAAMPSSGKIDVFNKGMTISFPKGTMLKRPETVSQINAPQVDLFNSQELLFGIADPMDGRTLKRYNRVGEVVGNVPQDGNFADVSTAGFASNVLQSSRGNFGYASKLFWVDAGYYDTTATSYTTVGGMHPYASNNNAFYLRGTNASKWLIPTNRGTITLSYDSSIRNEAAGNLSIWRFSDNSWKNIGGTVDTGKKTVSASFDGFGYYAVMSMRFGFEDVTGHPYARNQINTIYSKGIMEAKTSLVFGVYDNISRGEFTTMIVKMLGLPLNYDTSVNLLTFSDVPPYSIPGALWDYRYIETAARAGIIAGITPRTFNPGGNLSREQAATIIARAMNIKVGDPDKDRSGLAKEFTDAGTVDYYGISYVYAITKQGIMSGMPNPLQEGEKKPTYSFNPKSNLNRADMSIISYNVMKKLKKI